MELRARNSLIHPTWAEPLQHHHQHHQLQLHPNTYLSTTYKYNNHLHSNNTSNHRHHDIPQRPRRSTEARRQRPAYRHRARPLELESVTSTYPSTLYYSSNFLITSCLTNLCPSSTAIIDKLLAGTKSKLLASGVNESNIVVQSVPGSWELPIACSKCVLSHSHAHSNSFSSYSSHQIHTYA